MCRAPPGSVACRKPCSSGIGRNTETTCAKRSGCVGGKNSTQSCAGVTRVWPLQPCRHGPLPGGDGGCRAGNRPAARQLSRGKVTHAAMKHLLSYQLLVPLVLLLGLAPFYPQPHLVEKLGMLMSGTLIRPIDFLP